MSNKNNLSFNHNNFSFFGLAILILTGAFETSAQTSLQNSALTENYSLHALVGVVAISIIGLILWFIKSSRDNKNDEPKTTSSETKNYDLNSVDAEKEMEWLRKNQKLIGKKDLQSSEKKKRNAVAQVGANLSKNNGDSDEPVSNIKQNSKEAESSAVSAGSESKMFLPIFSIRRLEMARPFSDLPLSNEESLMDAIEQTQDEMEEDNEVRELAVRILAAFKTRNSVEALSQVALYDLLANLRSRAVTILCEFDHESVFEPILLTCADPTREVRAAAARALTKLTFDRADAWTRIVELDTEGRIVAAARAAIESGFVDMSFDRLVHQDRKYAYEAFALMALLLKAGETEKIFNALENHRDMNVRKALLHTIKVTKDPRAIEGLYSLLERGNLPIEFQEEIDKAIEEIGCVTV